MKRAYDVLVVGGGIIGQAVTRELRRDGLRTLLIYPAAHGRDSATLAAGAMIGAFGELEGLDSGGDERKRLELRIASQDLHRDWIAALREESGKPVFVRDGMFMIANRGGREDIRKINRIATELRRYGRGHEWVAPGDVPRLAPRRSARALKALFIRDDFSVDSADLMHALETINGSRDRLHDEVTAVRAARGGWSVTLKSGDMIRAPRVVIAAGARVPAILGETMLPKLRLPLLYFAKGIGCVVSGTPEFPHAIRTPNRSDACGVHVVPRSDGRTYIGASTHYGFAPAAARGITPGELTAILGDTIREIDAGLRDATVAETRFGLRPVSGDGSPLIGATDLPGLFLGTGTFRTGIVLAPVVAHLLSAGVRGVEPRVANPFRPADRLGTRNGTAVANLASLHADRVLAHYVHWKTAGDSLALRRARRAAERYRAVAGKHVDSRILQLLGEQADQVW